MNKSILLIILFLFPIYLFAQSAFDVCDPVFTKVEVIPSVKISNEAFADTLATTLKSKKYRFSDNEIICRFIVTDKSKISDFEIVSGNVSNEKRLKEAILQLTDLWNPATQNGHTVCSFVRLRLKILDNKISIAIMQ